jgi:hypothetical protein
MMHLQDLWSTHLFLKVDAKTKLPLPGPLSPGKKWSDQKEKMRCVFGCSLLQSSQISHHQTAEAGGGWGNMSSCLCGLYLSYHEFSPLLTLYFPSTVVSNSFCKVTPRSTQENHQPTNRMAYKACENEPRPSPTSLSYPCEVKSWDLVEGVSSVVVCVLSIQEALGSIPSIEKKKKSLPVTFSYLFYICLGSFLKWMPHLRIMKCYHVNIR